MVATFAQLLNSLDPPLIDGRPYGPIRFREIAKERYLISKHTNTSYHDTQYIPPLERTYILQFVTEDLQRQHEMYEKAKQDAEARRKS